VTPKLIACSQFTLAIAHGDVSVASNSHRTTAPHMPIHKSVVGRSRSAHSRAKKNSTISDTTPSAQSRPAAPSWIPCVRQYSVDSE